MGQPSEEKPRPLAKCARRTGHSELVAAAGGEIPLGVKAIRNDKFFGSLRLGLLV
jgi:hypothetical protein